MTDSPTSIVQTFIVRIYIITYSIRDNANVTRARRRYELRKKNTAAK